MSLNNCLTATGTYELMIIPTTITLNKDICDGSVCDFYGRILNTAGIYDTVIMNGNNSCEILNYAGLEYNEIPDAITVRKGDLSICGGDILVLRLKQPTVTNE